MIAHSCCICYSIMEPSVVVEENHQTSNSDIASKSMGSSIKIDSISIDLVSNDEIDAEKCEHFSIRGYVSEIRKKNWKMCWPFALDGNHDKSEEQTCTLPPLQVLKFRWWHCQNCLQEIGAENIKNNNGNALHYCCTRFKSNGTCTHISSLGDAAVTQSDFHQASKLNILEGKKDGASIATTQNDNDCHPSSNDKKEKKSESANTPIIENKIRLGDNMSQYIPVSASAATAVDSGLRMGRNHADDIVALKTNSNGSDKSYQPSSGSYRTANNDLVNKNLECVGSSAEICQTGKQPSPEVKHLMVMTSCGTSRVASRVDEVLDADKDSNEHPSVGLDECDNASSESTEILARNDHQDRHYDSSGGSQRRKTRKVRLLTELLAENGDTVTNLMRDENFPSNSVPDASAELAALPVLQFPVAVQEYVTKGFDQNRKRKFPRDEDFGPLVISSLNNFDKKDRTCNGDAEIIGGLASSVSEEDAGIGLQIGINNHLNKCRLDKSPDMGKKKSKKTLVGDEFLSLAAPSQENVKSDIQNNTGDADQFTAADIALPKSANLTSTSRGMYPFPLPTEKTERNSGLCKKKSKMPLFEDGRASLNPWSKWTLRGSPVTRKDIEIMQMPSFSAFQSAQDVSTGKGMHFFLNSCASVRGYDRNYMSPLDDWRLLWRGGISKENQVGKDVQINYVADSYFPSKSEPDTYQRTGMHCDLGSNNYRASFPDDKQKFTPQAEAGSSLMQQADFCGRSNNGKCIETQANSVLAKKHSDQRADNMSEQGALDDIPMEIVELMAKNQYERCLPDVENDNRPFETAISNSSNHIYGKEKLILLEETALKPKPQAKNNRNRKIQRAENVGGTKRKLVAGLSHIDRDLNSHLFEPTCGPDELGAFPQYQERTPSGVKFSDTSSSKPISSQNCHWIGNMVGHRHSQPNLQTLGACNSCQSVPQQSKEATHLWSSMIPNRMPFVYNIAQKRADPSTNIDVLSHYPISLRKGNLNGNHDLNFLNLNASNPEKHNWNADSENVSKSHAEHPFACKHSGTGSLDLYSNETIPAMHLLSLMDTGLPSGAPIDIDVAPKFLKRSSFPHDHYSKGFTGPSSGVYKTSSSTMKHPSYDNYDKSCLSQNSHEYFPSVPPVGASGYSFHHDKGVKKTTDFTCKSFLRSQEKEKAKCSDPPSKNKGHRSQKSALPIGGSGTNHGSFPYRSMQKMFLGTSDPMAFPLQYHVLENGSKHKLEACNASSSVWPMKSCSKNEICSVNRNPADFSTPEAGNVYMIRGEDLKFRKPFFSNNRSGLIKLNQHKRQRKLTAAKAGKV